MTQFFKNPVYKTIELDKQLSAAYKLIRDELLLQYNHGQITFPEFIHECRVFRNQIKRMSNMYKELIGRRTLGIQGGNDDAIEQQINNDIQRFRVLR